MHEKDTTMHETRVVTLSIGPEGLYAAASPASRMQSQYSEQAACSKSGCIDLIVCLWHGRLSCKANLAA